MFDLPPPKSGRKRELHLSLGSLVRPFAENTVEHCRLSLHVGTSSACFLCSIYRCKEAGKSILVRVDRFIFV